MKINRTRLRVLSLMLASMLGFSLISVSTIPARAEGMIEVTEDNVEQVKAMGDSKPVLFDISTSWCQYCKILTPMLKSAYAKDGGKTWVLAHIDGDGQKRITKEFGANAYPTLVGWGKGREIVRSEGAPGRTQSDVDAWIASMIKKYGPSDNKPTGSPQPTTSRPSTTHWPTYNPTRRPNPTWTTTRRPSWLPTSWSPRPTGTDRPTSSPTRPTTTYQPTGTTKPTLSPTSTVSPTSTWSPKPTGSPTATETAKPNDGKLPELPKGAVQVKSVAQYAKDVEEESKKRTVIIDFSKDQCMPCVALAPELDKRYQADKGKWQYVRIDGTEVKEVWAKFNNPWFPTLIAIKNGKELGRLSGYEGDTAGLQQWITDAAQGKAPATDPLVMDVKAAADFETAKKISNRHPVVLRLYDNKESNAQAQGAMAAKVAQGDGGKWTLANVELNSEVGRQVSTFVGKNGLKVDGAKHIVMYQGTARYEDDVQAFGQTSADESAFKAWIVKVLSHKYHDAPVPGPTSTPTGTAKPTTSATPTASPLPYPDEDNNSSDPFSGFSQMLQALWQQMFGG